MACRAAKDIEQMTTDVMLDVDSHVYAKLMELLLLSRTHVLITIGVHEDTQQLAI